jgi:predicted metal-binding protein
MSLTINLSRYDGKEDIMADYEKLITQAKKCGFTEAGPLDASTLQFMPEVRDMCAACRSYGKSWICPPACGTLDEMRAKTDMYSRGLLVQSVTQLEDSFDWDGIQHNAVSHGESFRKLWDELLIPFPGLLAMGSGHCRQCEACTYPDKPCRFPDRQTASMESCGLLVSKVCSDNKLPYYYGPGTIAYTACFLLE